MIRSTLLAAFIGLTLSACGEKPEAETSVTAEEMHEEIKATAEEMIQEVPSVEASANSAEVAVENAIEAATTE